MPTRSSEFGLVSRSMSERPTRRRVHIIGGPGSGKSTLAKQLEPRLGVRTVDLDQIAYARGGVKRTLAERRASIRDILECDAFITEGIYLWWIDELLQCADLIVWLDVPFGVAAWRIVTRHVRASLAGAHEHPGLGRLLAFLRSSYRYYMDPFSERQGAPDDDGALTRAQTARELYRYEAKVVRNCTSARRLLTRGERSGQDVGTRGPGGS